MLGAEEKEHEQKQGEQERQHEQSWALVEAAGLLLQDTKKNDPREFKKGVLKTTHPLDMRR
eukprot:2824246-Pyramimonas_sp.AAC.1